MGFAVRGQTKLSMQQTEKSSSQSSVIATVRRLLPSVIANDIVGVQPMNTAVGGIFSVTAKNKYAPIIVDEWHKVFVVFPRKTIAGTYRVGPMNRRVVKKFSHITSVEHPFGSSGDIDIPHYDISYQYATDKEVFLDTLGGKDAISV